MRILDLVEFQPDDHQKRHKELRFCQFYRKPKGTLMGEFLGDLRRRAYVS